MKKAVLFDMDGTLIDSSGDIYVHLNATLKKFGYNTITREEVKRFVGNGAAKLVERALKGAPCDNFDEVLKTYNDAYNFCDGSNTSVYSGMSVLVRKLKAEGYKTAVVSNKPQAGANEVVKTFFPEAEFDYVFGQREGIKVKPDRACVDYTLERLGVTTDEAVFVGDSDTDYLTMKNSCVDGVCVLWGYRCRDELSAMGAHVFASTAEELYDEIKKFG